MMQESNQGIFLPVKEMLLVLCRDMDLSLSVSFLFSNLTYHKEDYLKSTNVYLRLVLTKIVKYDLHSSGKLQKCRKDQFCRDKPNYA